MASKTPARRTATKTRRQAAVTEVDTTTSPTATVPSKATRGKKASRTTVKKAPAKRSRGRPRVSNTNTDRVTLRIEQEHLQIIDTLVRLKQHSNRSDAIRQAIKTFCDSALENVEDMVEKQQKRHKLMQLEALASQMAELQDQ